MTICRNDEPAVAGPDRSSKRCGQRGQPADHIRRWFGPLTRGNRQRSAVGHRPEFRNEAIYRLPAPDTNDRERIPVAANGDSARKQHRMSIRTFGAVKRRIGKDGAFRRSSPARPGADRKNPEGTGAPVKRAAGNSVVSRLECGQRLHQGCCGSRSIGSLRITTIESRRIAGCCRTAGSAGTSACSATVGVSGSITASVAEQAAAGHACHQQQTRTDHHETLHQSASMLPPWVS